MNILKLQKKNENSIIQKELDIKFVFMIGMMYLISVMKRKWPAW